MPCMLKCSRANVSCVLKCSGANVSCVLTCQRVLRAHALTCLEYLRVSRVIMPCVLTWLTCHYTLNAYILMYQRALRAHALSFQHVLSPLPYMACVTTLSSANMSCLFSSSFDATFFSLTTTVVKLVHAAGKVCQFN